MKMNSSDVLSELLVNLENVELHEIFIGIVAGNGRGLEWVGGREGGREERRGIILVCFASSKNRRDNFN